MNRQMGRNHWLAGSASLLALAAMTADVSAQQAAAEEPILLEEIIVTGTHLRGTEPIGSTLQTISADDLAESGRATVGDLMRSLPVNFAGSVASGDNTSGGQDFASFGGNLSGGQGVNLRGLGALSTLVLVNGRRVAASGQFGDFVDISNIPAASIARMEILPDGASAVYGSDAVGGVVNIILAKPSDEQVSVARIAPTTQGGGLETQLSHRFGHDWGTGGVVVGYEYYHRDRVEAEKRDIFNGGDLSDRGGVNWPLYTARAGANANIFSGAAVGSGTVIYTAPSGAGTGLTPARLTPVTNGIGNTYDPWTEVDILPRMERHSLFAGFDQELNDSASLYGDARFTRRRGNYRNGYGVLYNALPSTNPYYIAGLPGGGDNAFSVLLDDKVLERDVSVDSYGGQLGAKVDLFGDWQLDATASFSVEDQGRRSDVMRDSNVVDKVLGPGGSAVAAPSATTCALMGLTSANIGAIANPSAAQRFCAGLNFTAFNPYSTEAVPANVLSQLIGYEKLSYLSWLGQGSLKLDGTLFELPGGPVKLAVGTDIRREHIEGDLEFNYRSVNTAAVPYGATERDVLALFGEAAIPLVGRNNQLPLVKQLELSAAVRFEDYSGQGGDQDSIDPKFGLTWKPVDELKVKASWGTSFHAPPMRYTYTGAQPVPGGNAAFALPMSYTAPCNTGRVRLNGLIGTPGGSGNCSFNLVIVAGGTGGDLKPESAETWSTGFDFESDAIPGFKAGASYFNLKINDRIVRIDSGALPGILAEYFATGSSPYAANLNLNPTQAQAAAILSDPRFIGQFGPPFAPIINAGSLAAIIDATQINLATLKMDGLDFNLSYEIETDNAGTFGLFGSGTVIFNYKVKGAPGQAYEDRLDQYGDPSNPVSFRSKQGLSWSKGAFNITTTVNYTSDYECVSGCYVPGAGGAPTLATSPVKIDDWTTLDLHASYDLSDLGGLAKDASISLSVVNLFDKDPAFIDGGAMVADVTAMVPNPYDPANGSVIGRTIGITFTKRW